MHGQYLFYRVAHHLLISEKVTKNTNRSMTALFFFAQHLLFERMWGGGDLFEIIQSEEQEKSFHFADVKYLIQFNPKMPRVQVICCNLIHDKINVL